MTGDEPPPRLVPTHSCLDLPLDPCHALVRYQKYSRTFIVAIPYSQVSTKVVFL